MEANAITIINTYLQYIASNPAHNKLNDYYFLNRFWVICYHWYLKAFRLRRWTARARTRIKWGEENFLLFPCFICLTRGHLNGPRFTYCKYIGTVILTVPVLTVYISEPDPNYVNRISNTDNSNINIFLFFILFPTVYPRVCGGAGQGGRGPTPMTTSLIRYPSGERIRLTGLDYCSADRITGRWPDVRKNR